MYACASHAQMNEGADTEIFPREDAKIIKEKRKLMSAMENEH